jgi:hypothetical protein
MSDENAGGCPDGWCEWSYDPSTHTLCKATSASPGTKKITNAVLCTGGVIVEEVEVVDDLGGRSRTAINAGTGGVSTGRVLVTHVLNKFEKSPVVIYQKLGQFVEMDTDAASANFDPAFAATTSNPLGFTHNSGPGDIEQSGQAIWYEFWGLSGPNFQAEEGHDPYTWIMCGSRGPSFAEENCGAPTGAAGTANGGIDAPKNNLGGNAFYAIVKPPGSDLGGLDPTRRYGTDLRPTTGETCAGGFGVGDAAFCGSTNVMVLCVKGSTITNDPNTATIEANIVTSTCDSDPGGDGVYGTGDDGTIYYREATENGLRGFVRENRAHAFSFINGIGVNHPELCGSPNECADSPATGTRQVMFQNIQDLGATLSCFNCSALGQHTVPSHGFDRYNFKWTPLPGVHIPEDHPNSNGSIPEAGGEPSNGF